VTATQAVFLVPWDLGAGRNFRLSGEAANLKMLEICAHRRCLRPCFMRVRRDLRACSGAREAGTDGRLTAKAGSICRAAMPFFAPLLVDLGRSRRQNFVAALRPPALLLSSEFFL